MRNNEESLLHNEAKFRLFQLLLKKVPLIFVSNSIELDPYQFFNLGPFLELPRTIDGRKWAFLEFNCCRQCKSLNPNKRDFSCSSWCLKGLPNIIRPDISLGTSERETILIEIQANAEISPKKFLKLYELSRFFDFFLVEIEAISVFHQFHERFEIKANQIIKFERNYEI